MSPIGATLARIAGRLRAAHAPGRRFGIAAALGAAALVLIAMVPGLAQSPPEGPPACAAYPPNSPLSCNVLPLDAPVQPTPSPTPTGPPPEITFVDQGQLPSGYVGRHYEANLVFPEGSNIDFATVGNLPAGLTINRDRSVTGIPRSAGNHLVQVLILRGNNQGAFVGRWSLRVDGPGRRVPARVPRPSRQARPPATPKVEADPISPVPPGWINIYRLTPADFEKLAPPPPPPAPPPPPPDAAAASAQGDAAGRSADEAKADASKSPAPGPTPTAAASTTPTQPTTGPARPAAGDTTAPASLPLETTLLPLLDVEYPSESLFRHAVVNLLADAPRADIDRITQLAKKPKSFAALPPTLQWRDSGGFRAVRPIPSWGYRTIYGIMPFWWGQPELPAVGGEAPTFVEPVVEFSLFDRIGILGAQLSPKSDQMWLAGPGSTDWAAMSRFARAAQAHGTELDLVLEASNWSALPARSNVNDINGLADNAAVAAAQILDVKLTDPQRYLRAGLLPMWHSHEHLFNGITVMFTPPAHTDSSAPGFEIFFNRFMRTLIARMKNTNRLLTLNIAFSADHFCTPAPAPGGDNRTRKACRPGAFAIANLDQLRQLAAFPYVPDNDAAQQAGLANTGKRLARMLGRETPPTKFNLLIFVPEPVRESRRALRSTLDAVPLSANFSSESKIEMLRSIVPVIFGPGALAANPDAAGAAGAGAGDTIQNQLAYYDEVFGGAGFWPVPMLSTATGAETNKAIQDEFFEPRESVGETIIPDASTSPYYMSLALRLAWQALVLAVIIAILVYSFAELSDRTRRIVAWVTLGLASATIAIFFWLLYTDPALSVIAQGNLPLVVLVVIVTATVAMLVLKPKIRQP